MSLRRRLREGTKGAGKRDALQKGLRENLESKGVPANASVERAAAVLQAIGHQAVAAAYQTLDA